MTTITATQFKTKFDRGEFTYGVSLPSVRDKDIADAIENALALFNQNLYPAVSTEYPTDVKTLALLYLTAHELVKILEETDSNGQSKFNQNSRSVGSISESLTIPEWMNQDIFSYYTTTAYGIRFLMISKPYMDGVCYTVAGATMP